jgi:hypothetical protein
VKVWTTVLPIDREPWDRVMALVRSNSELAARLESSHTIGEFRVAIVRREGPPAEGQATAVAKLPELPFQVIQRVVREEDTVTNGKLALLACSLWLFFGETLILHDRPFNAKSAARLASAIDDCGRDTALVLARPSRDDGEVHYAIVPTSHVFRQGVLNVDYDVIRPRRRRWPFDRRFKLERRLDPPPSFQEMLLGLEFGAVRKGEAIERVRID